MEERVRAVEEYWSRGVLKFEMLREDCWTLAGTDVFLQDLDEHVMSLQVGHDVHVTVT